MTVHLFPRLRQLHGPLCLSITKDQCQIDWLVIMTALYRLTFAQPYSVSYFRIAASVNACPPASPCKRSRVPLGQSPNTNTHGNPCLHLISLFRRLSQSSLLLSSMTDHRESVSRLRIQRDFLSLELLAICDCGPTSNCPLLGRLDPARNNELSLCRPVQQQYHCVDLPVFTPCIKSCRKPRTPRTRQLGIVKPWPALASFISHKGDAVEALLYHQRDK